MTPQERRLVDDLFERLATLERNPREPDAEDTIRAGLRKAPNATYALVQTVLLQEEALRQANERIAELESAESPPQESGGFLDSMRDAVFGGGNSRSSVPPVGGLRTGDRPGDRPMGIPPGFQRSGDAYQAQGGSQGGYPGGAAPQAADAGRGGAGGSFLGTAAAAAAGVIGGSMLMNSLGGMFGGQAKAQGLGDVAGKDAAPANPSANPWGDAAAGDGNLAQQAGLDSVGRSEGASDRTGLYDQAHDPADDGAMMPEDDGGFDMDMDYDL
jgi:hypothetical protein